MFNKYQNMFRSRWKALWWAAGVCLTAYCTVPSQEQTDAQVAAAASAAHPAHVNPWALDKSAQRRSPGGSGG
ncbi:hypothetical protein [Croceibacterium aestuarii]|uniref:hypothetical protein n=1 Tax=Croceibacterium aestuarii TaxID=3064139 RepID=UPI00272EE3B6|nr:hypothetical protein [Croceibacterium sp. D39]